jgi:hypothetical protein
MKHRHGFAVVFFVGLWMTLSTVTYGQRADGEFVRRLPDGSLELTSVYPGDTITFPQVSWARLSKRLGRAAEPCLLKA